MMLGEKDETAKSSNAFWRGSFLGKVSKKGRGGIFESKSLIRQTVSRQARATARGWGRWGTGPRRRQWACAVSQRVTPGAERRPIRGGCVDPPWRCVETDWPALGLAPFSRPKRAAIRWARRGQTGNGAPARAASGRRSAPQARPYRCCTGPPARASHRVSAAAFGLSYWPARQAGADPVNYLPYGTAHY